MQDLLLLVLLRLVSSILPTYTSNCIILKLKCIKLYFTAERDHNLVLLFLLLLLGFCICIYTSFYTWAGQNDLWWFWWNYFENWYTDWLGIRAKFSVYQPALMAYLFISGKEYNAGGKIMFIAWHLHLDHSSSKNQNRPSIWLRQLESWTHLWFENKKQYLLRFAAL